MHRWTEVYLYISTEDWTQMNRWMKALVHQRVSLLMSNNSLVHQWQWQVTQMVLQIFSLLIDRSLTLHIRLLHTLWFDIVTQYPFKIAIYIFNVSSRIFESYWSAVWSEGQWIQYIRVIFNYSTHQAARAYIERGERAEVCHVCLKAPFYFVITFALISIMWINWSLRNQ